MHRVPGIYMDGRSSKRISATLGYANGRFQIIDADGKVLRTTFRNKVEISSRIGNTPRFFRFPANGVFETRENEAIDALLKQYGLQRLNVHALESKLKYAIGSLIMVIILAVVGIQYGLPAAAKKIAFSISDETIEQLGQSIQASLDRFMRPSMLAETEQERLRARFSPFIAQADNSHLIQVEFRNAGNMANAFALPSGTIVFTDEIIKLAETDEELIAVLMHEIGHVENRHGLRSVIQSSVVLVVTSMLTGDVSGGALISGLPIVLTQTGYSRRFEYEADRYSAIKLLQNDIDPMVLPDLLDRLVSHYCKNNDCTETNAQGWKDYVATHPPNPKRREAIEKIKYNESVFQHQR